MITCNYCGKPTQDGLAHCSYCGKPLVQTMSSGAGRVATPGQPELPAWLETLRAGEPGMTPPGGLNGNAESSYSPDDFVDESLLPSWMQAERNDVGDSNPSGKHAAQRPASTPAPNTDGAFIPTKGMSASSFIDAQFLPSWLQEKQIATPSSPQDSISAASLVQPDALPTWMRTAPSEQAPTPQPPSQYNQYNQSAPPQAIMGNDLIDQQVLPEWLAGKNVQPIANGQTGFAASSLVDQDELPPWMREGNSEQRSVSAEAFAPPPLANPQTSMYLPQQGAVQVPAQQSPTGQVNEHIQGPRQQQSEPSAPQMNMNSSLSASSFIDVNALPEWLTAPSSGRFGATSSQEQQGANEQQRPVGMPPRSEYVRVPSRPRNEASSSEDSTIAANAFASMLGVASAAPFFPGQQAKDASMGQGQMPAAQSLPPMQVPQGQNMSAAHMGNASIPNPAATWGGPTMQPAPYMTGQPGQPQSGTGFATAQPPTGYGMNTSLSGMQPPQPSPNSMSGIQKDAAGPMNNGQAKTPAKSAKRGFLSTILDWFSR